MTSQQISQLVKELEVYDAHYRAGHPLISDSEFDKKEDMLREIDPKNKYFLKVGELKTAAKKEPLPIPMFSMNKIKSQKEIDNWIKTNKLENEKFIITPKYDGLSLVSDEILFKYQTRGNGVEGHNVTRLFKLTQEVSKKELPAFYFGEGMILRKTFEEKYSIDVDLEKGYENPRNMVASLFNPETKEPQVEKLKDVYYIRYGMSDRKLSKEEQIHNCNKYNRIKVPYILTDAEHLKEEILKNLYSQWSVDFEIDGLVIDVNDAKRRIQLGRENNGNPKFARAYKGNFETIAETWIKSITWQTSKDGFLTPVAQIEPVKLDGATIDNVTLYNARTVKIHKLGILAKIKIKRSGGVIPKFLETLEPALVVNIPKIVDNVRAVWDENEVEIQLTKRTDNWNIQELLHFFRTFEVEEFGLPTVAAFYNAGFRTVKDILKMTEIDISKIEGFGRKKATFILKEFKEKVMCGAELSRIMAASNLFCGLGEKTLSLINDKIASGEANEDNLKEIDGIGEEKEKMYLDGIEKFYGWYEVYEKLIPTTVGEVQEVLSDKLKGENICFTGFRDEEMEDKIRENGGTITDGVSSKTTMLIVKKLDSGSSKISKAAKLGIKIVERDKFII